MVSFRLYVFIQKAHLPVFPNYVPPCMFHVDSMRVWCTWNRMVYLYARFDYIRFLKSRNSINGNDKIQLQRTFTSFKNEVFEVISTT